MVQLGPQRYNSRLDRVRDTHGGSRFTFSVVLLAIAVLTVIVMGLMSIGDIRRYLTSAGCDWRGVRRAHFFDKRRSGCVDVHIGRSSELIRYIPMISRTRRLDVTRHFKVRH